MVELSLLLEVGTIVVPHTVGISSIKASTLQVGNIIGVGVPLVLV